MQSGVTYAANGKTNYDDNKDGFMRLSDAYSVQLGDNAPSTQQPMRHTFAACSGSRMEDMVLGKRQLSQLTKNTRLVTMQVGG